MTGLGVPKFDRVIGAAAGDLLSIGAHIYRHDPVAVTVQDLLALPSGEVPEAHRLINATTHQVVALGANAIAHTPLK